MLNKIDAIAQASFPAKVKNNVAVIPINADKAKYFNLLPFLSASKSQETARLESAVSLH